MKDREKEGNPEPEVPIGIGRAEDTGRQAPGGKDSDAGAWR